MKKTNESRKRQIAYVKEWRIRNPEKAKRYDRTWRERNAEYIKAKKKEYREANRDKINEYRRKWRAANPDKVKLYSRHQGDPLRRKYGKAKASAVRRRHSFHLSFDQYRDLLASAHCYYCGGTSIIGLDRIDSQVGYEIQNVVPCCKYCNTLKNVRNRDIFITRCKEIAERFRDYSPQDRAE